MPDFTNTDTQNTTNYGQQGLRVYALLYDVGAGAYMTDWVDFGNVENLAKTEESEENNVESARNGVREVVKVLTSRFTESLTFDSLNVGDPVLAGLFEGNTALAAVAPADTNVIIRKPGGKAQARLAILQPGAPNTDSSLLFIPKVQIGRGQETASVGQEIAKLGFSVSLLTDEAYKVPTGVLASNDPAPNGVRLIIESNDTPIDVLHTAIDALIA